MILVWLREKMKWSKTNFNWCLVGMSQARVLRFCPLISFFASHLLFENVFLHQNHRTKPRKNSPLNRIRSKKFVSVNEEIFQNHKYVFDAWQPRKLLDRSFLWCDPRTESDVSTGQASMDSFRTSAMHANFVRFAFVQKCLSEKCGICSELCVHCSVL